MFGQYNALWFHNWKLHAKSVFDEPQINVYSKNILSQIISYIQKEKLKSSQVCSSTS